MPDPAPRIVTRRAAALCGGRRAVQVPGGKPNSTGGPVAPAQEDETVTTDTTNAAWPAIPLAEWSDTFATLHRWLQIAGKIRLAQSPWVNHSWNATLYLTPRGLATGPVPHGPRSFQIEFDFVAHRVAITSSDGSDASIELEPQTVAEFHRRLLEAMRGLGLPVSLHGKPNEVEEPIPFERDDVHRAYDPSAANRFWRALAQSDRVLKEFRARFIGKCSPVHFFWGAADLAVTRFSGRPAPPHPGGIPNLPDWVTREAYSHEVSSCGFWPGGGAVPYPAFYSYAYPEPDGFAGAAIGPAGAFYSPDLREFILPYDVVRESADPDETLLRFLQSTYEAAAELGGWDRAALERARDPRPAP
jgi:hypothetical protein